MALCEQPAMEIPFDLAGMWQKVQVMLRDSLDAMVNQDSALANDVCARDDEVDAMKREIRLEVEEMIRCDPEQANGLLRTVGRHPKPGANRRSRHQHRRGT